MVLYAAFQEQLTSLAYHALARRAVAENAPTVATIVTLIAHDEAYHGGGYRAFSRIFAELDLPGTLADAEHVARNFRMRAEHLLRDGNQRGIDIIRDGTFNRQLASEETIYKMLKGLGFVPMDRARKVADDYWNHSCRFTWRAVGTERLAARGRLRDLEWSPWHGSPGPYPLVGSIRRAFDARPHSALRGP